MCVSRSPKRPDHVVGIDLSARFAGPPGTRLASEKGVANVAFVHANGCRLPFPDDTFDTILSHAVIEHVVDHPAYLRDARRVLRPRRLGSICRPRHIFRCPVCTCPA